MKKAMPYLIGAVIGIVIGSLTVGCMLIPKCAKKDSGMVKQAVVQPSSVSVGRNSRVNVNAIHAAARPEKKAVAVSDYMGKTVTAK